jgi:hypothetical protein
MAVLMCSAPSTPSKTCPALATGRRSTSPCALRWPDAFVAGDVALHKILKAQGLKNPARLADAPSLTCKPWRSYAVIRTWSGTWREAAL